MVAGLKVGIIEGLSAYCRFWITVSIIGRQVCESVF